MADLSITLVQTQLFWEDKSANLQMLEKKIMDIPDKTELIVLPEMFSTGFSMKPELLAESMDGESLQWMKKVASARKAIITGSLIIRDNDHYYNRLIWMQPNGQYGIYDKRHRFAYADEDEHYTAGNKRLLASIKGWKINPLICYDLRFPVWSRQSPNGDAPEYDVLIYSANWPEKRIIAWKTLLRARAIENQSYVVGVNRTGKDGNEIHYPGESMVIDPMGEILYHKESGEDIFTISLSKEHLQSVRDKFPFWKDADNFMIKEAGKERAWK
jgi:omega-amidase